MLKICKQHTDESMSVRSLILLSLSSLTSGGERIVVMSIHQPRYSIVKLFDTLTLLSLGKLVYHGEADNALGYFNELGIKIYGES